MNGLEFAASVIGSLAWPVTVVAVVMVLRTPLAKVVPHLTRLRYGDLEMNFGKEIRQLEERAEAAGLKLPSRKVPTEVRPKDSSRILDDAKRLAKDFPEPAVGLAWTAVEHEISAAVMRLAISPDAPAHNSLQKNIALFRDQGYLDPETYNVLSRMRNLRNMAVHGGGPDRISADEAAEFIALAQAVVDRFKGLERN